MPSQQTVRHACQFIRLVRHYQGPDAPVRPTGDHPRREDVVFDWRLSRRHGELTSLIDGFRGILQSDGYGAYEAYAREHPEVTWVGCWAHARRKFFEAEREWPKAVRLILLIIGSLYECEACWDEHQLTVSNRRRHRRKNYPRRLYWLKKLATGIRERVPPKSGLGKACELASPKKRAHMERAILSFF